MGALERNITKGLVILVCVAVVALFQLNLHVAPFPQQKPRHCPPDYLPRLELAESTVTRLKDHLRGRKQADVLAESRAEDAAKKIAELTARLAETRKELEEAARRATERAERCEKTAASAAAVAAAQTTTVSGTDNSLAGERTFHE